MKSSAKDWQAGGAPQKPPEPYPARDSCPVPPKPHPPLPPSPTGFPCLPADPYESAAADFQGRNSPLSSPDIGHRPEPPLPYPGGRSSSKYTAKAGSKPPKSSREALAQSRRKSVPTAGPCKCNPHPAADDLHPADIPWPGLKRRQSGLAADRPPPG